MDRGRVERIYQQLAEIRQRGIECYGWETHQFKLNPPIQPEVLEAFEEKHQVRLPEEYRDFLLHVGNGGAGPHEGLYSLEQSEKQLPGDLKAPNPFFPAEDAQPGWFEDLMTDENYDRTEEGALPIVSSGDNHEVLLIISGPYRGRIVYIDWEIDFPPIFSPFPEFMSWYETWLREANEGYKAGRFGSGLPLDQEQSLAVAVDVQESPARRKAALNNLLRAPKFRPDQLALLHQAVRKESEGELAADMFVCLAQNGGTELEEVVWQVLNRAPSSQYLRLVETMRAANIADWIEAAEWAVEQDADRESVTYLLYDLERQHKLTRKLLQKVFTQRYGVSTALYYNTEQSDPLPVPIEFFTHIDPQVRRYAPHYQAKEELAPRLTYLLELFLQEKEESVVQGWVSALTYSYVPSIVDALIEYLKAEERHGVRAAIIVRLGILQVSQAVPVLLESALNDNWILAGWAVTSLGQIGTPEATAALETVASSDVNSFRGTGQGISIYPKSVIDMAVQQLQTLRGTAED